MRITTIRYVAVDPARFGERIQGGPGGNRIGAKLCVTILDEHSIDFTGSYHSGSDLHSERFNVYYKEATDSVYISHASRMYVKPSLRLESEVCPDDYPYFAQDWLDDLHRSFKCVAADDDRLKETSAGKASHGICLSETPVQQPRASAGSASHGICLSQMPVQRHDQLAVQRPRDILVQCDDPSSAMRAFAVLPTLTIGFDLSITARPSLTFDVADVKIKPVPKVITLVTGMPKPLE